MCHHCSLSLSGHGGLLSTQEHGFAPRHEQCPAQSLRMPIPVCVFISVCLCLSVSLSHTQSSFSHTYTYVHTYISAQARRSGRWVLTSALKIVPGDIISVVKGPDSNNIVPCDCLILSGSAIVNESSLTGSSHPSPLTPHPSPSPGSTVLAVF